MAACAATALFQRDRVSTESPCPDLPYPQQLPLETFPVVAPVPQQALELREAGAAQLELPESTAGVALQHEDSLAAVVDPQQEELATGRPTAFLTRFTKPLFFSDMQEASLTCDLIRRQGGVVRQAMEQRDNGHRAFLDDRQMDDLDRIVRRVDSGKRRFGWRLAQPQGREPCCLKSHRVVTTCRPLNLRTPFPVQLGRHAGRR